MGSRAPPAPHFLLLISQQPLDGFSSNLAHVCSSPGKNFSIWSHDISANQRSHMTTTCFAKGCACLDGNFKNALYLT